MIHRRKRIFVIEWVVVYFVCSGPSFQLLANDTEVAAREATAGLEMAEWLKKAVACYGEKGGFAAAFEHETFSRIEALGASGSGKMTGKIWVSSSGLFKMEYQEPSQKRVVFDGKKIRAYDKESNTVVERLPQADELFSSLRMVVRGSASEILNQFDVHELPSGAGHSLKLFALVPKGPSNLASKILITLGECPVLRRVIVVDRAGNMIRLTFSDIEIKNRFFPGVFKLKAPGGATIIRP